MKLQNVDEYIALNSKLFCWYAIIELRINLNNRFIWSEHKNITVITHVIKMKCFMDQGQNFIFHKIYILGDLTYNEHVRELTLKIIIN